MQEFLVIVPVKRKLMYYPGISAPTEMPFDILRGADGLNVFPPETAFGELKNFAVGEDQVDVVLVLGDFAEHGVAIRARLACGLPKLLPGGGIVVGHPPVFILNLQERGRAAVSAVRTDLLPVGAENPLAVQCPVVDVICVLLDADDRRVRIFAVLSVVDVDRIAAVEGDGLPDDGPVLRDRQHVLDIVPRIDRIHYRLQRVDVRVQLVAEQLQLLDPLLMVVELVPYRLMARAQREDCEGYVDQFLHTGGLGVNNAKIQIFLSSKRRGGRRPAQRIVGLSQLFRTNTTKYLVFTDSMTNFAS